MKFLLLIILSFNAQALTKASKDYVPPNQSPIDELYPPSIRSPDAPPRDQGQPIPKSRREMKTPRSVEPTTKGRFPEPTKD